MPAEDASTARQVGIDEWKEEGAGEARQQVMVFRYGGKFVAVDHVRKIHFAYKLLVKCCFSMSFSTPPFPSRVSLAARLAGRQRRPRSIFGTSGTDP